MKRRIAIFLGFFALATLGAGAASADSCACGGGWTYDRYWSDSHGPGHYDCLWYRTAPPYSAYVEHNC